MDKIATENLFLLEFLVDNVSLNPECECNAPPGETCVSFQFLDNAPMDVCEADFSPKRSLRNDSDTIKSGKSCLFSLSPQQAHESVEQFDIYVSIFKKMQPGWLPDKVEIGAALISIANLFAELINSVEASDGNTPTAKTLKDDFDIHDATEQQIGKIGVYIRMSCFGKLIVTQFQMNLEDKSVLFKDKEGKSLYRYKKAGRGSKDPSGGGMRSSAMGGLGGMGGMGRLGGMGGYNAECPTKPCGASQGGMGGSPNGNRNPNCPFAPCGGNGNQYGPPPPQSPCLECGEIPDAPCIPPQGMDMGMGMGGMGMGGMGMGGMGMGGMGMGGMGMGMMTPCLECGNIPNAPCLPQQNMGCGGGGGGFQSGAPCLECANIPNPPCMPSPPPEPEGNYQEIGASMGGNSLTIRVHKDKSNVEQVDPSATNLSDNGSGNGCPCAPGQMGKKKRGQSFTLGPGVQQGAENVPFSLTMGKGGQGGNNGVTVNPPVATCPDGTQLTEFSDPNKELFILRIGKKSEGVDKKQNLELELCTPKGPELKPIPKKETRDTQYDTLDIGSVGSKKGKKGDKNGKKKK